MTKPPYFLIVASMLAGAFFVAGLLFGTCEWNWGDCRVDTRQLAKLW